MGRGKCNLVGEREMFVPLHTTALIFFDLEYLAAAAAAAAAGTVGGGGVSGFTLPNLPRGTKHTCGGVSLDKFHASTAETASSDAIKVYAVSRLENPRNM